MTAPAATPATPADAPGRLGRAWAAVQARLPERVELWPGWPSALIALALGGLTAVLISAWAVDAPILATRSALLGLALLALGLLSGSGLTVGWASLPMLGAAVGGLDRAEGHAWGQVLILGLLWYAACELAWASIEDRREVRRTSEVERLRTREVATVVALAALVGLAGIALASQAPVRTGVIRAVAVAAVLATVAVVGQHLSNLAGRRADQDDDQSDDREVSQGAEV